MSLFTEEELVACAADFFYFLSNYVNMTDPIRGLVPYTFYDYHKRLIQSYEDNRFVLVRKFRRGGFTSITALWALWKCAFTPNQKIMFVGPSDIDSVDIGRMVDRAIWDTPIGLLPKLIKDTIHEKHFAKNGSTLSFRSYKAIRGRSVDVLIIDEAAFHKNIDVNWKYMYPCLADQGKCFIISTPGKKTSSKNKPNWFFDMYETSLSGKNMFKFFSADYLENPFWQNEKNVSDQKNHMGADKFANEVLGAFLPVEVK